MPNYDYICTKCSHKFRKLTSYEQRDAIPCPKCGTIASIQFNSMGSDNNEVYDIVVPLTNKKCRRGVQDMLKDRWRRHKTDSTDEIEGVVEEHGLDSAKAMGYITEDNKKKKAIDQ